MDKLNVVKVPAWIIAVSRGALVLAPLGFFGCSSGTDTSATATDETSEVIDESPPVVLTQTEQADYAASIDESKALLDKGDVKESLPLLERSAKLNPDSFAVHNNYCMAYANLGLRDQAIAECERAVQIEPDNQLGKNNLNWVNGLPAAALPQ